MGEVTYLQHKFDEASDVEVCLGSGVVLVLKVYHFDDAFDVFTFYLQNVFATLAEGLENFEIVEEREDVCETHGVLLIFDVIESYFTNVYLVG